jgi:SNF2 family DNA or RNA helicase
MGLGKTLQTLTWMSWLRGRMPAGGRARFLIVCPKSVAPNWQSELGRFLPKWRSHIWRGDSAVSLETAIQVADVLVVNYAQLRRLQEPLEVVQWNAVVLDEAQAIKNPESQTAQGARRLNADHRLALTGTPIENRLLDLWSILAFAMPGVLGNRAQFQRSFGSAEDPLARRRLAARVRPFLLRRTKSQVAQDLPDRVEEDLSCEMEGVQKRLYDAEFKKARALLLKVQTKTDLDQFRFHFLTSLLRLRQICCHPALVDDTQHEPAIRRSIVQRRHRLGLDGGPVGECAGRRGLRLHLSWRPAPDQAADHQDVAEPFPAVRSQNPEAISQRRPRGGRARRHPCRARPWGG